MGRLTSGIDDKVQAFIEAQRMFFVASAPLAAEGHGNLSPKGLDTRKGYIGFAGHSDPVEFRSFKVKRLD